MSCTCMWCASVHAMSVPTTGRAHQTGPEQMHTTQVQVQSTSMIAVFCLSAYRASARARVCRVDNNHVVHISLMTGLCYFSKYVDFYGDLLHVCQAASGCLSYSYVRAGHMCKPTRVHHSATECPTPSEYTRIQDCAQCACVISRDLNVYSPSIFTCVCVCVLYGCVCERASVRTSVDKPIIWESVLSLFNKQIRL
jgi:hypothetical protein